MKPEQTYELEINIQIRPTGNYSQGLRIQETAIVKAETFLQCAKILGMFHDLAQEISKDQVR